MKIRKKNWPIPTWPMLENVQQKYSEILNLPMKLIRDFRCNIILSLFIHITNPPFTRLRQYEM